MQDIMVLSIWCRSHEESVIDILRITTCTNFKFTNCYLMNIIFNFLFSNAIFDYNTCF